MNNVVSFHECPDCCGRDISTNEVEEEFPYGASENPVMLKVTVPVRHCNRCEYEWTDYVAEGIRSEAVKEHLAKRSDTCG